MKLISLITAAFLAIAPMALGANPKILVLYYSQTGSTEAVAQKIASLTGADIEKFDVVETYDGDFGQTVARASEESRNGTIPALKPIKSKFSEYDVIFLGYPIWSGTYARPVMTLLKDNDFTGKTIVPFCTFGSGGLNTSRADLVKALPSADVAAGFGARTVHAQSCDEPLKRFLIESRFIDGSVEPLPEYSEQKPVSEAEKILFDEACGDYAFPLGTPSTVGSRAVKNGTDYKFTVSGMGGTSTIYVCARDGQKAYFTEVVR